MRNLLLLIDSLDDCFLKIGFGCSFENAVVTQKLKRPKWLKLCKTRWCILRLECSPLLKRPWDSYRTWVGNFSGMGRWYFFYLYSSFRGSGKMLLFGEVWERAFLHSFISCFRKYFSLNFCHERQQHNFMSPGPPGFFPRTSAYFWPALLNHSSFAGLCCSIILDLGPGLIIHTCHFFLGQWPCWPWLSFHTSIWHDRITVITKVLQWLPRPNMVWFLYNLSDLLASYLLLLYHTPAASASLVLVEYTKSVPVLGPVLGRPPLPGTRFPLVA